MLPRRPLDIGWFDLWSGFLGSIRPQRSASPLLADWFPATEGTSPLISLSIRSGWDALLTALQLPPGSEILVSAITIKDMPRIITEHGLVPVPVDLDPDTLQVSRASLEQAWTPQSRVLLVAQLFGSRAPLDDLAQFARAKNLLLVEDCAQAWNGQTPEPSAADVCLWSFGPIKTSTALGGGVLTFRDQGLRDRVAAIQSGWPVQSRGEFAVRVLKYALLKGVSWRPCFTLFVNACRWLELEYDRVISSSVRGFSGPDFFRRIRRQPSPALVALLRRRIQQNSSDNITRRCQSAAEFLALLPDLPRPGRLASQHQHWVFPTLTVDPERLSKKLVRLGFDATRGASSMGIVAPPPSRPETEPHAARRMMKEILYLPVHERTRSRDLPELVRALAYLGSYRPQ